MRNARPLDRIWVLVVCSWIGACASNGAGGGAAGVGGAAGTGAAGTSASGAAGTSASGAAGTSASGAAGTSASGAAGSAPAGSGAAGASAAGTTGGAPDGGAGTSTDAGAAGSGAAGAGVAGIAGGMGGFGFSGASRCGSAGGLLCESFENGLDATVWTTLTNGEGTATVDDTRAFRGSKSLHIKVVNAGHKAAISETKTFPIANNVLYARMFVWFDSFTTTAHFTMVEAPQTGAGAWARFGGQNGKYGVGTDHGASGDWTQTDTAPVATKQWTCLEIAFKGDTNEFRVWQDEVERPALNTGATKHAGFVIPPMTSLWFGWQTYSNQAPGEFWVDEIAVDSKPIGCVK